MAHVPPVAPDDVPALATTLDRVSAAMGFVPNSMLTMAHMPQLPVAFSMFAGVTFGADLRDLITTTAREVPPPAAGSAHLPPDLIQLIAYGASLTAGCRYCQAHTSHSAHRLGVRDEKLADILDYEDSEEFTPAERAAVALAFAAAAVPNESGPAHFARLREHFSEPQIVQIVAVIALFGFLNRWNDTMATALEDAPMAFADVALGDLGWRAGKHGK